MTQQTDLDMEIKSGHRSKTRLIVDLVGPFVVHFVQGIVKVHVPLCADHHANILTDRNDVALPGIASPPPAGEDPPSEFVYHLETPEDFHGHKGRCGGDTSTELLVIKKGIDSIPASKCHIVFKLPNPDEILPLVPERVFIHRNNADIWFDSQPDPDIVNSNSARALRLIYGDFGSKPPKVVLEHPKSGAFATLQTSLEKLQFDACGYRPHQYHFTLRFASSGTVQDNNHEDAYNCFQTMRTLIPKTLFWRVDFEDLFAETIKVKKELDQRMALLHHGGPTPVDCNAALLIVQNNGE